MGCFYLYNFTLIFYDTSNHFSTYRILNDAVLLNVEFTKMVIKQKDKKDEMATKKVLMLGSF